MNLIPKENEYSLQGTKVDIIYICITVQFLLVMLFPCAYENIVT